MCYSNDSLVLPHGWLLHMVVAIFCISLLLLRLKYPNSFTFPEDSGPLYFYLFFLCCFSSHHTAIQCSIQHYSWSLCTAKQIRESTSYVWQPVLILLWHPFQNSMVFLTCVQIVIRWTPPHFCRTFARLAVSCIAWLFLLLACKGQFSPLNNFILLWSISHFYSSRRFTVPSTPVLSANLMPATLTT